jgi:pimeloyl-ACP methyl ester carboxylesterase
VVRVSLPRVRGTALVVVLLVLLAGCSVFGGADPAARPSATPSAAGSGDSTPSADPTGALATYYRQQLSWKACGANRCATLRVPLDYARPTGRTIGIALLKVPARDRSERLGSMVVNPGGPGISGVGYASSADSVYGDALRRVYDTVGFDPRGVGASAPVECATDSELGTFVESDPDPDTAAERRYSDGLLRQLGRGCLDRSGDVTRHVSTVEVARDLDILRAALGDAKLTYFGASYGTFIGATYANLFPKRVGRMVLDGAVDPSLSTVRLNLEQAHGFEVALRAYVGACVDRGGCFLGDTVDEGVARIQQLRARAEAKPLKTTFARRVGPGDVVYGLWYPLYNKALWPILDQALEPALRGDGSLLLSLADTYLHRTQDGRFTDNAFEVFYAVNCLDHDDAPPSSQVPRSLARFEKASPTFGPVFAYSAAGCDSWPVHSGTRPHRIEAAGSPPIMVVGTTRDPATPLAWAESLADQLEDGVLVTRDGDGHTGYHNGSPCVDRTVEAYLVAGRVPKGPVSC